MPSYVFQKILHPVYYTQKNRQQWTGTLHDTHDSPISSASRSFSPPLCFSGFVLFSFAANPTGVRGRVVLHNAHWWNSTGVASLFTGDGWKLFALPSFPWNVWSRLDQPFIPLATTSCDGRLRRNCKLALPSGKYNATNEISKHTGLFCLTDNFPANMSRLAVAREHCARTW